VLQRARASILAQSQNVVRGGSFGAVPPEAIKRAKAVSESSDISSKSKKRPTETVSSNPDVVVKQPSVEVVMEEQDAGDCPGPVEDENEGEAEVAEEVQVESEEAADTSILDVD